MSSLKEFLAQKARQVNQVERRKRRDEWISAVDHLRNQLKEWLRQADTEGVLDVEEFEYDRHEESIGPYVVKGLEIRSDNAEIVVIPVGYGVMRPDLGIDAAIPVEGRVDITNKTDKVILYRTLTENGEEWLFKKGARGTPTRKLDQAAFEEIIQEQLS